MVDIRALPFGFALLLVCSALAGLGPVAPEDFLAIKTGDSYAEVSKRFGQDLRHSFTVRRQGHEWRLFKCYLKARRYDGLNFKIGDAVEMVRTRLGDPSVRHSFPESGLEVWSYAYTRDAGCLIASQMCSRLVLVARAGTIESIYNTDLHGGSGWLVPASWL